MQGIFGGIPLHIPESSPHITSIKQDTNIISTCFIAIFKFVPFLKCIPHKMLFCYLKCQTKIFSNSNIRMMGSPDLKESNCKRNKKTVVTFLCTTPHPNLGDFDES